MAITSFSELKTAIDNWLARSDLTSRSPEFIALAEARMNRELETRSQEKRVTTTTTADDAYITLPADARRVRHVRLNTSPITVLKFYTPGAADSEYASTGTGKPIYYATAGNEIYLRPTPDATYTVEIDYIASIVALDDTNTSNTILQRHPDAYLHGSLAAAYGYLLDEQRQAQHDQLFTRAMAEIKADEERVRYAGAPLVVQSAYGEIR